VECLISPECGSEFDHVTAIH